jgi:hypothetical protein
MMVTQVFEWYELATERDRQQFMCMMLTIPGEINRALGIIDTLTVTPTVAAWVERMRLRIAGHKVPG